MKKLAFEVLSQDANQRLDQYLALKLPGALNRPLSKAAVRKLIVAGAVYLNGKRVRIASKSLLHRARIEVFVDLAKLENREQESTVHTKLHAAQVLFEDEYLIAFDKPAGLPTQPTLDEARANLFHLAKKFLADRDGVAQPYLGLHHRLDVETSGVVLFTKKEGANRGLATLFAEHRIQKTYRALCGGGLANKPKMWSVENFLGPVGKQGKKTRYGSVRSGGDRAVTRFHLLTQFARGVQIEAMPQTGRTHQIRVHLSEGGHPILGDTFYGAQAGSAPRVMLHAVCLTFRHPVDQTEMAVQSPIPADFQKCIEDLKNH